MPKRGLPGDPEQGLRPGQRFKRDSDRRSGRPHEAGYTCVAAEPVSGEWAQAVTSDGRPSLLRCIWRGMYNVRGLLGDAAESGEPRSQELNAILYRYTMEGDTSIYKHVNYTLAFKLQGEQPTRGSGVYFYTEKLTSAIRLLWAPDIDRIYRGVSASIDVDVDFYRDAQRTATQVQWTAFSSTSLSRDVALTFAGPGGVLFTINRDSQHAAAADISRVSQFPNEQEVLLLPMARFNVLSIHIKDVYTEIVLREVSTYPGEL